LPYVIIINVLFFCPSMSPISRHALLTSRKKKKKRRHFAFLWNIVDERERESKKNNSKLYSSF